MAAALVVMAGQRGWAQSSVEQSASIDAASLIDHNVRLTLEPLVIGRLAFGVSVARWNSGANSSLGYFGPVSSGGWVDATTGHEWMADVGMRFYPAALSSANAEHRLAAYVGALAGLHRREGPAPVCPGCGRDPLARTSVYAYGVEPAVEGGMRFFPIGPAMVDVGVRTRLITFDDPAGNFAKGDVDTRLAINLGVAW